jgi:hypothetical protein
MAREFPRLQEGWSRCRASLLALPVNPLNHGDPASEEIKPGSAQGKRREARS